MSLLERRRAMMQLADGVEGGGPCDGKVIVFRSNYGNYSNARYVSTDYGHSYSRVTSPGFDYSCSNDVDFEGGYWGNNTAHRSTWISGSNPKATAATWTGDTIYREAFCTSLPDEQGFVKIVSLLNSGSNYSRVNRFNIMYRTGSTVGTAASGTYSGNVPSYISSVSKANGAGAFINGNRADLTKLIITAYGEANVGAGGVYTASLSLDGGYNWTNIKDVLLGSQSSLPDGQYRDSVWSFDGKKGAVIYNNTLYVSSDGGQSWTARSSGDIGNVQTLAEIKGTEKLKTLYLLHTDSSNVHTIKFSTDFGKSWKTAFTFQATGVRFLMSADGKHFIAYTATTSNPYIWWADANDDGTISNWTTATGDKPASTAHSSIVGSVRMSLDNRRG